MSLYYSGSNTATVAAASKVITVAGIDLTPVQPGMTISLGSREFEDDKPRIIASRTTNADPSTGGTITLLGAVPSAFTSVPFVIDTRDFNGTAANYALALSISILNSIAVLTGAATNLFSGSKQIALDKTISGAIGRVLYAIGGRNWFGLEQIAIGAAEYFILRAYPDGTAAVNALTVNGNTGGVDFLVDELGITAAATTDIGSLNARTAVINGVVAITSFGVAARKERHIRFTANPILTHNATSLILPGGVNIATAVGDTAIATSDVNGNWRVRSYTRANGYPLVAGDALATAAGLGPASMVTFGQVNLDGVASHVAPAALRTGAGSSRGGLSTRAVSTDGISHWALEDPNGIVGQFFTFNGGVSIQSGGVTRLLFTPNAVQFATPPQPQQDNTTSCGTATARFTTYFGISSAISTSDQAEKTELRAYSDLELDAIGEVAASGGIYQWLTAVAAKGPDGARLHCGYTAQSLRDALLSRGLDPARYAAFCADELTTMVTGTRTVRRQQMEMVSEDYVEAVMVDGHPMARLATRMVERPAMQEVPLLDADGRPILYGSTPATFAVPAMQSVDETYQSEAPLLDETGAPVVRLGLRYDLVTAWILAYQRREMTRLAARVALMEPAA